MGFVIHWHESAMDLHVFPIPIPPLHPIPVGLPNAPGPSTCLMHPTWAGDQTFSIWRPNKRHLFCKAFLNSFRKSWKVLFPHIRVPCPCFFYVLGYAQSFSRVQLFVTPTGLARLLWLWKFPGKNTGEGNHTFIGDLPDPELKPTSLAWQADSLSLGYQVWDLLNLLNYFFITSCN